MKRVLFVCTGNTCRSPMAEAILTHMSKQKQFPLEVRSAGIYAVPGADISPQAKEVLTSEGIQTDHCAQRLDHELLEWADVILTMTLQHKNAILLESPSSDKKVYTLTEYITDDSFDIIDPYGSSVEVYRRCAEEIHQHLEDLIKKWSRE
ncbi:low molecular weight protein arginine phosphatase [Shimazuella sp. AN120528]|uniref:low molecular weight protein arginine phosphatase n=1 Tax=Shimazuella soli TaxID=1892854 RepID=UPI001F10D47E|nr:low molecular weight protein arginine phosphatase [Shimazuella soli]MCH5585190.1 low molecular weight protein arginine phosphatase [Shimazuella soli]